MPKEKLKSLRLSDNLRNALIKAVAAIRFSKANETLNEYIIVFWWKACNQALEADGIDWRNMNLEYMNLSDSPFINSKQLQIIIILSIRLLNHNPR